MTLIGRLRRIADPSHQTGDALTVDDVKTMTRSDNDKEQTTQQKVTHDVDEDKKYIPTVQNLFKNDRYKRVNNLPVGAPADYANYGYFGFQAGGEKVKLYAVEVYQFYDTKNKGNVYCAVLAKELTYTINPNTNKDNLTVNDVTLTNHGEMLTMVVDEPFSRLKSTYNSEQRVNICGREIALILNSTGIDPRELIINPMLF